MKPPPTDPLEQRRLLSALADGDEGVDAAATSVLWAQEPSARATWHAYQLIGDVMRSDDLAGQPQRDARLLCAVRERLAREPVVLASAVAPTRVKTSPVRRWLAPAAVAAGFAAVAGMLVSMRMTEPAAEAPLPVLATSPPPGGALQQAALGALAPRGAAPVQELKMIRDPRLDSYLRAHREGLGGASVAVPGGALRSVETLAPQR